ncbi:LON peptidase substrate-binding domain-containing protein [Halocynthiibacter sp. C4]|uniref:LON peptidase substrate-binding domain-containing protein n=1 Tax=Halocynthiibacter sp. C4 TaxID=2992758 RepID=UPI00237A4DEE|nr:LON peptidase substrate-binding domain-containing protein [Halocynthiibacter sp. C4]MDE0591083.1 LON peptidase substrate-binding domain-containing protein [Halocynthiibacter sp. C4]
MLSAADLPSNVPLFPLPGALLLPRGRLPLQIFEPRYLAMLEDCLKTSHRLIGMIQPISDQEDDSGQDEKTVPIMHKIGCAGRVVSFSETVDGRYMVTLAGISRFRLREANESFAPYLTADVSWKGFERDLGGIETDSSLNRDRLLTLLEKYFNSEELETDWESLKNAEDELLINSLSMLCPFSSKEKQALLEAEDLASRRETLTTLMEFALRFGQSEDRIQ